MRVSFLLVLSLICLFSYNSYSQCSVTVSKTDVICNGGTTGTATANPSGGTAPNNCVTPPASTATCTSCSTTVSTNSASFTVNSGQKVCLTATNYTGAITVNIGGTLVICGSAVVSSFSFNGGTIFINGSLTISNGLSMNDANATLSNYGTLSISGGFTHLGQFNNHGTCTINSGDLTDNNTTGVLFNTNLLQIPNGSYNHNNAASINSGTFTMSGNFNHFGGTFTNNCNITVNGAFNNNFPLTNNGRITVGGLTSVNSGGTITAQSGSELTTASLNVNSTIDGAGAACSSVKVNGNATINSTGAVTGLTSLCVTGSTSNNSSNPATASHLNCTCNVNSVACTYLWNNGATTPTINNLIPGTYTVVATCNGCNQQGSVTISSPSVITITPSVTNVTCLGGNNGSISISVSGGASSYTYDWGNGITSQNRTNLTAGTYSVTVKDINNCTGTLDISVGTTTLITASVTVNQSSAHIVPAGGQAPYVLDWDNGLHGPDQTGLPNGTYVVIMTDANGCKGSVTVTISGSNDIYAILTKKLDGGYYNTSNGKLYFKYFEEYLGGDLTYKITDYKKAPKVGPAQHPLTKKYGENEYILDLTTCGFQLVSGSYYILEVKNGKNDTYYLRLKYTRPSNLPVCN
jgi:hypothetical protein